MSNHYSVIIVGGGQAGLSVSYNLKSKNIDHIIFDRGEVGDSWRQRWDNFTLVTPNWQCELPGYKYAGKDSKGFMNRQEVIDFVSNYAKSFDPPIKKNVEVLHVSKEKDTFLVKTSSGLFTSNKIVIASGAFNDPVIPQIASKLPNTVLNLHSSEYRNAASLPDKEVMVVGSGQSGCQIAEDLHLEGKKVHLCVGNAPKSPRKYRGKDVVEWLDQMSYYDKTIDTFEDPVATRNKVNHYVTGRDGGREIDLRVFANEGMKLYGLFNDVKDGKIYFGDNLKQDLDNADKAAQNIKDRIDEFIVANKIEAPKEPGYLPPWEPTEDINSIDIKSANIGAVIWCIGYKTNYSWLNLPLFDKKGYPIHNRGISTTNGVYFIGLPWMYTWGSGRFSGITKDSIYLAEKIEESLSIEV